MSTNRAARLTKTFKILKKHYKPVEAPERSLLEHLLYACCLESAAHEQADEIFAKLQELYFDWNEIRVTSVSELTELMQGLPDAAEAATRLKRALQMVFETRYSFDLEELKKMNQGKAVKDMQRFRLTPFTLAYTVQHGLGGHSIPVNQGALDAFVVVGVISESEARQEKVPGMERAISKSKGAEFGALLHQLGIDYAASPFSTRVRNILLEIDSDAKDRFPKRGAVKKEPEAPKKAEKKPAAKAAPPKAAAKAVTKKAAAAKPAGAKKKVEKKPVKKVAKKTAKAVKKKSASGRLAKKKPR